MLLCHSHDEFSLAFPIFHCSCIIVNTNQRVKNMKCTAHHSESLAYLHTQWGLFNFGPLVVLSSITAQAIGFLNHACLLELVVIIQCITSTIHFRLVVQKCYIEFQIFRSRSATFPKAIRQSIFSILNDQPEFAILWYTKKCNFCSSVFFVAANQAFGSLSATDFFVKQRALFM